MASDPVDPRYIRGVELFDRGEYFDSHEVWEELWIEEDGPARRFYQGLIQAAVSLFHLQNGNLVGSRKLMDSSAAYLAPYCPAYMGLDLERLLGDVRHCFEANRQQPPIGGGDLEDMPKIHHPPQE